MEINLTDKAAAHLKEKQFSTVRVVARDTYECSTMIEFYLQEGVEQKGDQKKEIEGITFLYDAKAEEEIGQTIKIDFVHAQGLKLLAPRGTLAYAQKVKPQEKR